MSDPSSGDVDDVIVAIESIEFGEARINSLQGSSVGYDLDGTCTCPAPRSCTRPDWIKSEACDGVDGIDNGFAGIVSIAKGFYQIASEDFASSVTDGEWTVLIRLTGYNGQPNDTKVAVSVYPAARFNNDPCNDAGPAWQGDDYWPQLSTGVVDGGQGGGGGQGGAGGDCGTPSTPEQALLNPKFVDLSAYVNDGTLVANFSELSFNPGSSVVQFDMRLVDAVVSGKLEMVGSRWHIADGLLAGRWRETDMFDGLGVAVKEGDPLCTDNVIYTQVKTALCTRVDVTASLGDDCDAIAFGMSFQSTPANLGIIVEPPVAAQCEASIDPANDNCDQLLPP